jgi:hypothetical protein
MATHTFDVAAFRAQFPAFADQTKYPNALLSGYVQMATCFVSPNDTWWFSGDCLQLALDLMTAHLATVYTADASGSIPGVGIITSATIDKVSVTSQVPKTESAWRAFLLRTPYGLQLVALLQGHAAGGWTVGGSLERQAFRKAGGIF